MVMHEARSRRQAGRLARLCNEVHDHFGRNPKGTGALERHSALLSSPGCQSSLPNFSKSSALIGAPCHRFALADVV